MLVAVILAIPLMRMSGLMAGLGTFAVLLITNVVAVSWREVTRGTNGMAQIPISTTATSALIWALVMIVLAYVYQMTTSCLRLRASREDVVAARAIGVRVSLERTIAFALSGFIVGVGGALYAQYVGSFNPDAFYLAITLTTLAMLVIGGTRSLAGAVIGTIVVSALSELLRRTERAFERPGIREIGLALAMIVILVLRPRGLTGGKEIPLPHRRWRGSGRPYRDRSSDESVPSEVSGAEMKEPQLGEDGSEG